MIAACVIVASSRFAASDVGSIKLLLIITSTLRGVELATMKMLAPDTLWVLAWGVRLDRTSVAEAAPLHPCREVLR
jgi:hypothetical protein